MTTVALQVVKGVGSSPEEAVGFLKERVRTHLPQSQWQIRDSEHGSGVIYIATTAVRSYNEVLSHLLEALNARGERYMYDEGEAVIERRGGYSFACQLLSNMPLTVAVYAL